MNLLVAVILTEFAENKADVATPRTARGSTSVSPTESEAWLQDDADRLDSPPAITSARPRAPARSPSNSARSLRGGSARGSPLPMAIPESSSVVVVSEGGSGAGAASSSFHPPTIPPTTPPTEPWPVNYSLLCFGPHNPVRRGCVAILQRALFQQMIIVAIILSSFVLVLDSPRLDQDSLEYAWLHRCDIRTYVRTDGRTGGRADGRTGGRTDGRTDGHAYARTHARIRIRTHIRASTGTTSS